MARDRNDTPHASRAAEVGDDRLPSLFLNSREVAILAIYPLHWADSLSPTSLLVVTVRYDGHDCPDTT